jgi:hypothetical protein
MQPRKKNHQVSLVAMSIGIDTTTQRARWSWCGMFYAAEVRRDQLSRHSTDGAPALPQSPVTLRRRSGRYVSASRVVAGGPPGPYSTGAGCKQVRHRVRLHAPCARGIVRHHAPFVRAVCERCRSFTGDIPADLQTVTATNISLKVHSLATMYRAPCPALLPTFARPIRSQWWQHQHLGLAPARPRTAQWLQEQPVRCIMRGQS